MLQPPLSSQLPWKAEAVLSTLQRIYLKSHLVLICCWVDFGIPGIKKGPVFHNVFIPELPWKNIEVGNQKAKRNGDVRKVLLYTSGETLTGQPAEVWVASCWPYSTMSPVVPHLLATSLDQSEGTLDLTLMHARLHEFTQDMGCMFLSQFTFIYVSLMPSYRPIN